MSGSLPEIDLVMKGGAASGLVYAGALPRLAVGLRFRGIAGASVGAIAAAFAAAAELARRRGDPHAFERLRRRTLDLSGRLPDLLDAEPPLRPLLSALIVLAPGSGRPAWGRALLAVWPAAAAGALAGLALLAGLAAALGAAGPHDWGLAAPGLVLAAALGALGGPLAYLAWAVLVFGPRHGFGLCRGRALTQWVHEGLQEIAFGAEADHAPLTFGDLRRAGLHLRMPTTNLTQSRPHLLPDLDLPLAFEPAAWARLMPPAMLHALPAAGPDGHAPLPAPDDLPVAVAVRMSAACPGLIQAVPVLLVQGAGLTRHHLSDGGLTANFPLGAFDHLTPPRPTLALDLASLDGPADAWRAGPLGPALDPDAPGPPEIAGLGAFVWSVLGAMREGPVRAALRARPQGVFQVRLARDEGGMNLHMTDLTARRLMDYGEALARLILDPSADGAKTSGT